MTEESSNPQSSPARRVRLTRRIVRRIVIGSGVALLFLLLLAAAAPTLLATSWGKGLIESRLSKALGMPVVLGECSLGWRSPTQIRNLRLGPSPAGLRASVAELQASFSAWDWIADGEELSVEIVRPEISILLPGPSKPEPEPKPQVPKPEPTAAPTEPKPEEKPLPFRKLKLSVREGMLGVENVAGARASAAFEIDATLLAESFETELRLRWNHELNDLAELLPVDSLAGKAQGEFEIAANRAGGRIAGKYTLRDLRVSTPQLASPLEESLLEFSLGEGKWNLLLGDAELRKISLRAQTQQLEIRGKAKTADRFKEWKLELDTRLPLEFLARFLPPDLPSWIPLQGPLDARLEATLPIKHPERALATLQATGRVEGKSWNLQADYDGKSANESGGAVEPQLRVHGQFPPIPVQQGFLSTLAYPIPLLASKDSHLLRLESQAGASFQFETRGRDLPSWKRSLRGEGRIAMTAGTLAGPTALGALFEKLGKGALRFEGIEAPFRIENETVVNPGVTLSAKGGKVVLAGKTGFDGMLEYTVRLEIPERPTISAILKGSVRDPQFEIPADAWKDVGKELLEEGLEAWKKKRRKD